MEYHAFGATGLRVSGLGFGAWAIGGPAMAADMPIGWGEGSDDEARAALERARELGVTFYDTADFYGLGHSEELIGSVLGNDPSVNIATKVGHKLRPDGSIALDYSAKHIVKACEASLRRLRRDAIDYYQLHSAKLIHLQEGECIEAMESLRDDGKIRFWGVSLNTFHPEIEGDYLLANGVGNGVQCVLNILNQRAVSFIERARDQGYGVIARMPLQFGLLTGKFTRRTRFPADDHRSVRLTPNVLEEALEALEEVWPIAGSLGMSRTALSLSFAASVPGVTTVIPGIRTSSQVEENVAALRQLSADQVRNLGEIYRRRLHQITSLFEAQG